MPLAKKILPNYTHEEYLQWEGRWEIIEGIPYAMTPSPLPVHQRLANEMGVILHNQLKNNQCPCAVYQPIDLKISEHTVVQPDLSVVCGEIKKSYLDFPPVLVVEILSPASKEKDLFTKRELYAGFGIAFYIIVDPENSHCQVLQLKDHNYLESLPPYLLKLTGTCTIYPDFTSMF